MIAFISGHMSLSIDEFEKYYKPAIDEAVTKKHDFIIGDCKGADEMSMCYLNEIGYTKVTVIHMFTSPRHNYGFKTIGGFKSDIERDSYGSYNSDYDILYIRLGKEKSGTAKNIARRFAINKLLNSKHEDDLCFSY